MKKYFSLIILTILLNIQAFTGELPSDYFPIIKISDKIYLDKELDNLFVNNEIEKHYQNSRKWFQNHYKREFDVIIKNYIINKLNDLGESTNNFDSLFPGLKDNEKKHRSTFYIPSYIEKIFYNNENCWLILYHYGQEDYFDINHYFLVVRRIKDNKNLYINGCK